MNWNEIFRAWAYVLGGAFALITGGGIGLMVVVYIARAIFK